MLREAAIVDVPTAGMNMPYALFALIGITVWGMFTLLVISATASISAGGALVSKVYFPREVLVLSSVGGALINTLIRAFVVLLSFVLFNYLPHWQMIFIPVVMLPLVALAVGLGLFLAPINTMMHDMSRVMDLIFQFGMFLVPAIYPTPDLEKANTIWQAGIFWLHKLNPVTYFIDATRSLIANGTLDLTPGLIASSVLGFLMLAMGWRFFHACEPLLAERI
jgi:lipopolysaccharide transport system permease protein